MNKREQEQLAAFFEEIYQTEELLDFLKLQLAQSANYSPQLLFHLISHHSDTISLQQMRHYLDDKVPCNQRELYEIFQRFDWSRQGAICIDDFVNELTPFGRQLQQPSQSNGSLTVEVEGHFISLLLEILKRFRILEVIRRQLRYIQPYDAFEHIDHHKVGYLSIPSLRRLFFENDFNVTDRQLYFLLHGLRRRCYRDVNLEVFCQSLDPTEFGLYTAYQDRIDEEKEIEFANRSREEEEVMKRSRVQAQRIQHEFQKAERKKQAELGRQLELQDKVTADLINQEDLKERSIRRALLEEDRNIRYDVAAGGDLYRQELIRNQHERLENERLSNIKLRQQEVNAALSSSAIQREHELERSRRAVELERDYLHRQAAQEERRAVRNNLIVREEQASRRAAAEGQRLIAEQSRMAEEESRRRYDLQLSRRQQEESRYESMLAQSKREIGESRRLRAQEDRRLDQLRRKAYNNPSRPESTSNVHSQHQRIISNLDEQRRRAREEISQIRNNRVESYEKDLQQTRYDAYGQSRRVGEISSRFR